jgi:membrane fusion protein
MTKLQRPLFRNEALEFQQHNRQWGDVALLQPLSTKIVAWFLAASAAVIILFLFVGQYSRKEIAVGYLTPTTGTAKIFAAQRGTIKAVHVEQGSTVREGQPLLTIETDQISADGIDVNASMLNTLRSQKGLIAENIKGEEQRTGSERERLTALVRGIEAEIFQLEGQIELQTERLKVVESDRDAADQLRSRGFMSAVDFKRRQIQVLEQKQAITALNQQLAARRNQVTETQFALRQLPTVMAQKVQALRNDLAWVEQRIAEISGRRAYVIRAPTSGRISTLQATVGQNADPQRLQLEIIPEAAVLQAELFLPARAIGFVEPGQAVRILYEAFPYQHFGTYRGRVVKVSQTILTSSDAAGPIKLNEPAYRVTAALERPDIDAYGKRVALQPDMLLKADVILEKRSLMSWLTNPLRGVRM